MIRNAFAFAISMTILWCLVVWVDLKVNRVPSVPYEAAAILLMVAAGLGFALRRAWPKLPPLRRAAAIVTVAVLLAVIWFAVSVLLVLKFLLLIGGHL